MSLLVYAMYAAMSELLSQMPRDDKMKMYVVWAVYYSLFPASCMLSVFAFLAVFRKFISGGNAWMDSLADNAYMIYLIHYIFVVWIQFLLLRIDIPAIAKFATTFTLALLMSWMVSSLLRRIAIIKRYI